MKIYSAVFLITCFVLLLSSCKNYDKVSFAICTDIHADIMHDEVSRLKAFIQSAEENKLDFIIELGDFCQPDPKNDTFLNIWNSYPGESYHVLGNHDMDVNCKDLYMDYTEMVHNYYSFDLNNYHFIVMDANFFESDSGYTDYEYGNYYAHGETRCNIPPEQIEWLKKDLEKGDSPAIVFSHQGLLEKGSVRNNEEVRKVLEESGRVKIAFSGHAHSDYHQQINGIDYLVVNSMSNIWVGEEYKCDTRFSEEVNNTNPSLKYTIPYTLPLFATVRITKGQINIVGVQSDFIPPGPDKLDMPDELYGLPVSSSIQNRDFTFDH